MDSLPDYETRAAEADRLAEAAKTVALAQEWRDIAKGYRLLAGLAAARPEADPTDGAPIISGTQGPADGPSIWRIAGAA